MANWYDFCKVAQTWGYYGPAHDANETRQLHDKTSRQTKDQADAENYGVASLLRGISKGIHNTIPGLADMTGSVAGLINGTHHGLENLVYQRPGGFGGGFSKGFNESSDFAKKYYSDPIRYAQMFYGGDRIKKGLDDWKNFYKKRIMDDAGPAYDENGRLTDKYREARDTIGNADMAEAFASKGTEWGLQSLMLGSLLKGVGAASRAAKHAPSVASSVGSVASKAAPAARAFNKTLNIVNNPWLQFSLNGLHGAIGQKGVNDAMMESDANFARNSYLRKNILRLASEYTREIYKKGLTPEQREEALENAKHLYDQAKLYSDAM